MAEPPAGAAAAGLPPNPGAAAPAPRVMLLSLWNEPGRPWHARLVASDAEVHDFSSPFELARFVAHDPPRVPQAEVRSLK